jgi:hypothetical protein
MTPIAKRSVPTILANVTSPGSTMGSPR